MNVPLSNGITRRGFSLSRFFNTQVEESWRLRILGLAYLWLASLGLVWTGGSFWLCLVGALGTLGHWLSWRWRHQPSKLRSLLIALLVAPADKPLGFSLIPPDIELAPPAKKVECAPDMATFEPDPVPVDGDVIIPYKDEVRIATLETTPRIFGE